MKIKLDESNTFLSNDLSLVASLVCWNFSLLNIDKTDPKRAIFVFAKTDELTKAVQSFWNNKGLVNPKGYSNTLRELKSRIREGGIC